MDRILVISLPPGEVMMIIFSCYLKKHTKDDEDGLFNTAFVGMHAGKKKATLKAASGR